MNIIVAIVATSLMFVYLTDTEKPFPTQLPGDENDISIQLKNCSDLTSPIALLSLSNPEYARKVTIEDCREHDKNATAAYSSPDAKCEFSHDEAVQVKHFIDICDYLGYNVSTILHLFTTGIKYAYRPPFTQKVPAQYTAPTGPGKLVSKDLKLCSDWFLVFGLMVGGKLLCCGI